MTGQAVVQATKRRLDDLRELVLLERAQRVAAARDSDQQTKIRELAEAVDRRLTAVESLTAADQIPAALVILREAALLAIRMLLESRGAPSEEHTAETLFRTLASMIEAGDLPSPPKEFDRVRALLTDSRQLAFDDLPTPDLVERRSETEVIVSWVRQLVDARTLRQIKGSRVLRLLSLALLVIGVLGWAGAAIFSPKNIARGKPVQLSSIRPNCPAGSGVAGLPASGLVDGSIGSAYEICTKYELRPWLTIDLLQVSNLSKAIVYGRGDCCFGMFDLPAVLELSQDGKSFTEVARRTTAYTATNPWVVPLGDKPARVLRLRVDSTLPRELVLNELEVFAAGL